MQSAFLLTLLLAATFEPENLKGVTSMRVVVENVPGADKVGLDPNLIQTDVEATLRKAGLKVTQIAGMLPYVYLQLSVLPLPNGCVAYSMHVALKTGATVVGTKTLVMSDLWSDGVLSARCKNDKKDKTDVSKIIRQSILDEIGKMANDIRSANPES
jgi:hypothetical protein